MSLAALGVVFGDIGTSPLYTFQTVLEATGGRPNAATTLGVLSLIVWTLIAITTMKYVSLAMSVDNEGEGGIMALISLLGAGGRSRPLVVFAGLFGAALIYGDGAITPAISVLSALEGSIVVAPELKRHVLLAAIVVLIGLFAVQRHGTDRIGRFFGPVMVLWFAVISALGIYGIVRHPAVLWALDPVLGVRYLLSGGGTAFLLLGAIFLCVTGAEALYADMGHFGRGPIRLAWSAVVFPALVLNYAGQAATVLEGAPAEGSIFFHLCPKPFQAPLVVLSTVATIIAAQAIITGAFSMTRQAVQLGWLPRLRIVQTSPTGYGQIYVPSVNWLLMIATLSLTIGFGKSSNLAAAYGIAVSGTMLITTMLLFVATREIWGWSLGAALLLAGTLAVLDAAFLAANMAKFLQGGWVPLAMGVVVYAVMLVWRAGAGAIGRQRSELAKEIPRFLKEIAEGQYPRVPGTAVFLARRDFGAPPILLWHLMRNRALHEAVLILDVATSPVPHVASDAAIAVKELAPGLWLAEVRFGFMQRPDVPAVLVRLRAQGYPLDLDDVTYYLASDRIAPREDGRGMPHPLRALFAYLQLNAAPLPDYFHIPREKVIEIGRTFMI
jgi:KUP system potassium uptake protein